MGESSMFADSKRLVEALIGGDHSWQTDGEGFQAAVDFAGATCS